jgi:hypothetical protein
VEEGQIPHRSARKPGVVLTSSRRQSIGTILAAQTPSGGKSGVGAVTRDHLRNVKPGSGNAALATRLSTISRGETSSFILVSHSEHGSRIVRQRFFSYSFEGKFAFSIPGYYNMSHVVQVPATAIHGKRFILFDDDDDDDDEP